MSVVIERSREDLEVENMELRERVELLEDQVRRMLAAPSYVGHAAAKVARDMTYDANPFVEQLLRAFGVEPHTLADARIV